MLQSDRLRNRALFSKIVSAEEAAARIEDGMTVGVSGFTPSGYPKAVTLALAKAVQAGKKCRVNLFSGASVGAEIEEALAAVDVYKRQIHCNISNCLFCFNEKGIGRVDWVCSSHYG